MIRTLLLLIATLMTARAACTVSGYPRIVQLRSKVIQTLDDLAYRAGRDVWNATATQADSQIWTWLVWSTQPEGQRCRATFVGVRNDYCGSRINVQFEQRTPYNVGFVVSHVPEENPPYPFFCTVELDFHVQDMTGIPNPNPDEPPTVEPGYHYYTVIALNVTGERYTNPDGMPSTPRGVDRNGCVLPLPGDDFPSFMLNCNQGDPRNSIQAATRAKAGASLKRIKAKALARKQ
jgi:hypothetical protein